MTDSIERKIAVIFATDVVGYSSAMERDEIQTLKNLRSCKAILMSLLEENGGRVFNTAGDSVLAEFTSAVSAVICASEFQRLIAERNSGAEEKEQMLFRVGLNIGDVVIEDSNLYGEGVNIAARLEASAMPGGVTVSKSFFDLVDGKTELAFKDVGTQRVKQNVFHAFDLTSQHSAERPQEKTSSLKPERVIKKPSFLIGIVAAVAALSVLINNFAGSTLDKILLSHFRPMPFFTLGPISPTNTMSSDELFYAFAIWGVLEEATDSFDGELMMNSIGIGGWDMLRQQGFVTIDGMLDVSDITAADIDSLLVPGDFIMMGSVDLDGEVPTVTLELFSKEYGFEQPVKVFSKGVESLTSLANFLTESLYTSHGMMVEQEWGHTSIVSRLLPRTNEIFKQYGELRSYELSSKELSPQEINEQINSILVIEPRFALAWLEKVFSLKDLSSEDFREAVSKLYALKDNLGPRHSLHAASLYYSWVRPDSSLRTKAALRAYESKPFDWFLSYNLWQEYLEAGEIDLALEVASETRGNPPVFAIARAYSSINDHQKVLQTFDNDGDYWQENGTYINSLCQVSAPETCIESSEILLANSPQEVSGYELKSSSEICLADFTGAEETLKTFERVLFSDPSDSGVLSVRAEQALATGRIDTFERYCRAALVRAENGVFTEESLLVSKCDLDVALTKNQFETAEVLLSELEATRETSYDPYGFTTRKLEFEIILFERGNSLANLEELEIAFSNFQQSNLIYKKRSPRSAELLEAKLKARYLLIKNEAGLAIKTLERGGKYDFDPRTEAITWARALSMQGDHQAALSKLERITHTCPMAPEPLITQAEIAKKAGNETLYLSSLESAQKSLTVADADFHLLRDLKKIRAQTNGQ